MQSAVKAGIDPQVYDASVAGIRAKSARRGARGRTAGIREACLGLSRRRRFAATNCEGRARCYCAVSGTLQHIEQRFGVQREILVAIWGIESDYGAGGNWTIRCAGDPGLRGPRSAFGQRELLDALRIEQQEHLSPAP